ncbi:hypothetical protein JCM19294_1678 [Nonlabens tegetincola]|uniref:Uncharacterized protein n=1 Tax=Nonlabens tegetincola TaxID=323273 RepID=A0A090QRG2_9FLAO|nr:hypothetical protein [Nonlabens tegetincola]GAK98056.1 hypothetical protein JCM19294_1678 [Nonlabens tegetincola]
MYTIEHQKSQNNSQVILESSRDKSQAVIILNEGARVQQLKLDSIPLIADLAPLKYADTYAS